MLPVRPFALLWLLFLPVQVGTAAHFNHDESAVPPYTEPDVLRRDDGHEVRTAQQWITKRRPQVLQLLRAQMFGFQPSSVLRFKASVEQATALDGLAIREQVTLTPVGDGKDLALHLLIYTPRRARGPVPLFLGLNYGGNQSVTADPGVELGRVWVPDAGDRLHMHAETATSTMRGTAAGEWPIETMLQEGFGFATLYDGDVEPDFDGGRQFGFRSLATLAEPAVPDGQRWGAISAWAWGLSRALDYLKTDKRVDGARVAVIGHSRLGKAALWAGAEDPRFAMVISNESGKGGAALMMRNFGETVEHLNTRFPYWFDGDFKRYSKHEDAMPFDSDFLLALVAPRPLYVASAAGDFTLDARGEYEAARLATRVYALFGLSGVSAPEPPSLDAPTMNTLGYHDRPGKHDMTLYDWQQYLHFASKYLKAGQKHTHPQGQTATY